MVGFNVSFFYNCIQRETGKAYTTRVKAEENRDDNIFRLLDLHRVCFFRNCN